MRTILITLTLLVMMPVTNAETLQDAIKNFDPIKAQQLIAQGGVDIEEPDKREGHSPLIKATYMSTSLSTWGSPKEKMDSKEWDKLIEMLLKAGADTSKTSRDLKNTPLHIAADGANYKLVSLMLEYGANPNAKDIGGQTPYDGIKACIQAPACNRDENDRISKQKTLDLLANASNRPSRVKMPKYGKWSLVFAFEKSWRFGSGKQVTQKPEGIISLDKCKNLLRVRLEVMKYREKRPHGLNFAQCVDRTGKNSPKFFTKQELNRIYNSS